nr:glycosyltransferase family 39 protein [Nitrosomonas sp.]
MKNYRFLVFLLLTSLTMRLSYYFSSDIVMNPDAITYVKLARHLASGDWRLGLDPFWSPLLPILTAIVSVFSDSLVLPISTISIFAGSLAVFVTYYLVKQSYGEREAVIAAVIATFYPSLLNSTIDLETANIYLLLINFALITSWKGLIENSKRNFLITGLLLGLAYLTRPEAFGYLIFFVPLAFSKAFMGQKAFSQNHTKIFLAFLLGFFLLAAPYILYIRSETGYWTISAKFQQHIMGGNFGELLHEKPDKSILSLVKSVITNFYIFNKSFYNLFPQFLLIPLAIGLFRKPWTIDNYKREIFLLGFCVLTVLC